MRNLIIAGAALALVGCGNLRQEQRIQCEQNGGVYHTSQDADDDVCVFSRDKATRVEFFEQD